MMWSVKSDVGRLDVGIGNVMSVEPNRMMRTQRDYHISAAVQRKHVCFDTEAASRLIARRDVFDRTYG